MTLTDNVVFQDYVNPILCKELEELGFPSTTLFKWHLKGDSLTVNSRAFDYDDYYLAADKIIEEISPADEIINAHTIMDVVRHCPPWAMCTDGDNYRVAGQLLSSYEVAESERFPDALAMYLIALVKKRAVVFPSSFNFKND